MTQDFVINHIKKTFEHGHDIATALKRLEEFDLSPFAPTLAASTAKDDVKEREDKQ